jgi:hypothetical protein
MEYVIQEQYKLHTRVKTNIKSIKNTPHIYFSYKLRPPKAHLALNIQNIPFVNHVIYVGVILDKRITWRLHIERIEHLSSNIKIILHKALISSLMTYDCTAWELGADNFLLKLRRL